ncbi:MAG TPA: hypothetical protein VIF57_10575 [Polyangia bacterium]|jgi:hypothetical protein
MKHPLLIRMVSLAASFAVTVAVVPRAVCGLPARPLFDGELAAQDALAREVAREIAAQPERHFYRSGSRRFDGQSAIAIYQMAILGMGQIIREHPERRDEYLPAMRAAAARLTDPRTLPTAAQVWGHNGLVAMAPGEGHAYLGYVNLALGMLRAVDPATPYAALHDRLTAALAERLDRSPTGLIETYPGETWPPDVAAVAGSIGLHAAVAGVDRSALLARWARRFEACAVHRSGYLVQRVRSGTCKPIDAPRGSGTAIASYFLGFADARLSRRLYAALRDEGRACVLGFCGIREYAPGFHGKGDGDAGPMMMGVSVGATGFALGAARAHGDGDLYRELYRSAHLVGVPVGAGGNTRFAAGGALGNALLLAMLTANRIPETPGAGR